MLTSFWRNSQASSMAWWRAGSCWTEVFRDAQSTPVSARDGFTASIRACTPSDMFPSAAERGGWPAVLAGGPQAALSHRSAAQLWSLLPGSTIAPELTRSSYLRPRPAIKAHQSLLPSDELTQLDGIPVTSLSRTLLDLASVGTRRQVEKAFNEAEVRGLTDKLSVPDLLERYPGRRGSAMLRAILAEGEQARGITREELEERFVAILAGTDLPPPRRNDQVAARGRFFEVDCLWAEQRLVVELDGRAAHGTDPAFERDRQKDRILLVEGWNVTRITWRQLREEAPRVVADLRSLLRERSRAPTL